MNKVYLDENIFYIEDFINKDAISVLKEEIDNLDSLDKDHEGLYHDVFLLTDRSQSLWNNIVKNLEDLFDNDDEYLHNFPHAPFLIKYVNKESKPSGWAMYPHADNVDYKDDSGEYENNVLKGIVIYVTDDYQGGEIVYINKDITFKPKAGYLVCHPGSTEYTHGVKTFTGGNRIIITGFVHKRKKPN